MASYQQPVIEPKNFIKRFIVRTIQDVLPGKTKRLIVVSAAIGISCHSKEVDDDVLAAINAQLHLGRKADEMKYGVWINEAVFSDAKKQLKETGLFSEEKGFFFDKITESDLWKLSASLARVVPFFLCYGTLQLMTVDIHGAIEKLRDMFVKTKYSLAA